MCLTVSPFLAGKITLGVDSCEIISVDLDSKCCAAMLGLFGSENIYCHLIGTDRDSMKHGVNNFLHHELIVWAKARGYKNMLIGGGRTNAEDDPLLKFKKNFSNSAKEVFVGERVFNSDAYEKLKSEFQSAGNNVERLLFYRQDGGF